MRGSSYIEKKYNRTYDFYAIPIWILMVGLILISIILIVSFFYGENFYFWVFVCLLYLLVFDILVKFLGKGIRKNDKSWGVGMMAEDLVGAKLGTIGDDFKIVHNIIRGKNKGNIDHVVIGPTGIFAIETKANRSWMYYYENNIRKNSELGKKFTKQAAGNAFWLHDLIKDKLGIEKFVQGVVARPFNKDRKIKMYCPGDVCIMDGNTVCEDIKNYNGYLAKEDINKICDFLNKIKREEGN